MCFSKNGVLAMKDLTSDLGRTSAKEPKESLSFSVGQSQFLGRNPREVRGGKLKSGGGRR